MLEPNLKASKPGAPTPRIDKRSGDHLNVVIDCVDLLRKNEIIYGQVSVTNTHTDITIDESSTKQGKYIVCKICGGPDNVPYTDYKLVFSVKTSYGSILSIPFTVRAYSV